MSADDEKLAHDERYARRIERCSSGLHSRFRYRFSSILKTASATVADRFSMAIDSVDSPQVEIGSQPLVSWSQSVTTGAFVAIALARAATSVDAGSVAHTFVLTGLVLAVALMLCSPLASKSVAALAGPDKKICFRYSLASITLYRKTIELNHVAWVRARFDGYQVIFLEAGTRGYEIREILQVSYDKGLGLPIAEGKATQLAWLWDIENKGYQGAA